MRIFALSDIHVDYDVNLLWVQSLSTADYQDDVLVLAGDVTDSVPLLEKTLRLFVARFRQVLFVPGNHDLWVRRDKFAHSIEKFEFVNALAKDLGVATQAMNFGRVAILPLLSWYDYSFGQPSAELRDIWVDFRACAWPPGFDDAAVTGYFDRLNDSVQPLAANTTITFSHFLPRIDLMPEYIPSKHHVLYPVFGSYTIERQLRRLQSDIHVFGHSHLNQQQKIAGVRYVNNAFGYPRETRITAKRLLPIFVI